ncbi:hypothetical protein H312_01541 [Anncaliia algerae PRA339]|uniref:Uncharacterized protein n=1 Tax=Anncaliia algerae PRA339 TaxID=1288291 RepID=A0A059F1N5_9MICR|nr:hypothetical protein H312_01541 [Anncaliia algerae PRA339]
MQFVERNSERHGGNMIVNHFDETQISHRHGFAGRHNCSNAVWVVGVVDIISRKCFLKFLHSRSRSDLFHFFLLGSCQEALFTRLPSIIQYLKHFRIYSFYC